MKKHITILTATVGLILTACSQNNSEAKTANTIQLDASVPVCDAPLSENSHPMHERYTQELDKIIAKGFPGVSAAIYTPGHGLWLGAAGQANRELGVDMHPCHLLFSGSVAKTYTVTAAMTLVETGMLNLDSIIGPQLPENVAASLPNAQVATVRQLMNHTAGIPDHDDDQNLFEYMLANDWGLPPGEDQLAYIYDNEPAFFPGEETRYSSANTLALSLLIDRIAGVPHADIIENEILQPLGLQDTYYKNQQGLPHPENLVSGYIKEGNSIVDYTDEAVNYANSSEGDAGIMATAYDYYRFISSLVEGQIVSDTTFDTMLETAPLIETNQFSLGFGLGLIISEVDGKQYKVGHSGSTVGGLAHMYYYPTVDSYIVLTTNINSVEDTAMIDFWSAYVASGDQSTAMSGIEALIHAPEN